MPFMTLILNLPEEQEKALNVKARAEGSSAEERTVQLRLHRP
jgi:plasmid stability protein